MATVNLGRIKPVWQGAWDNSTQYVAEDIVQYNNHAWVATTTNTNSAPSDANSNWDLMARGSVIPSGGSNGQVLTADGSDNFTWEALPPSDDASALTQGTLPADRLPAGTILKVSTYENNTRTVFSNASSHVWWSMSHTKAFTNSHLVVISHQNGGGTYCDQLGLYVSYNGARNYSCISKGSYGDCCHLTSQTMHAGGLAAGTYTLAFGWDTNGGEACKWTNVWNTTSSDDGRDYTGVHGSTVTVYEIAN